MQQLAAPFELHGTLFDNRPAAGLVYLSLNFTSDTDKASESLSGIAQGQSSSPNKLYVTNALGPYSSCPLPPTSQAASARHTQRPADPSSERVGSAHCVDDSEGSCRQQADSRSTNETTSTQTRTGEPHSSRQRPPDGCSKAEAAASCVAQRSQELSQANLDANALQVSACTSVDSMVGPGDEAGCQIQMAHPLETADQQKRLASGEGLASTACEDKPSEVVALRQTGPLASAGQPRNQDSIANQVKGWLAVITHKQEGCLHCEVMSSDV